MTNKKLILYFSFSILALLLLTLFSQCNSVFNSVDYNTEVKPILNKHCITCHGGIKQSSNFSLLSEEIAFKKAESGKPPIVRGEASESEFIRRLTLEDEDERMPYDAPPLSKSEIKTLKKWVNQGAKWGLHWSYQPLTRESDDIKKGSIGNNIETKSISEKIDYFITKEIRNQGLKSNGSASRADLLRRASFDIIGMPAPTNIRHEFLNSKITYEELVDRLLESPSYGEKWTSMWLDIARYADTKGFERDGSRSIWRYRDYIIDAFNKDKPYDQFLIEQLAGDLLEDPTDEQLTATGFHRNTPTNDEGGTDNEEYRVKAVLDRVNTTWEGILGTTMACVQCHGHPYDPILHEEYYTSYAYFNNTRDADTYMDYPRLRFLDSLSQNQLDKLSKWVSNVENTDKASEIEDFVRTVQPVLYSIEVDQMINADLYDTKYLGLRKNGSARIPQADLNSSQILMMKAMTFKKNGFLSLRLDSLNGAVAARFNLDKFARNYDLIEIDLSAIEGIHDIYLYYENERMTNFNERGIQIDWFYFTEDFPGKGDPDFQENWQTFEDLVLSDPDHTLIFTENPPEFERKTFVFDRGNWQTYKQEVKPGVPGILPSIGKENSNRLDFANWIASENNPLTSRTFVNRIWEQLFGRGIVRTVEDLGSQGEVPSHPELLNTLSYDWMHDMDWSIKSLIKAIVMTETYQKAAHATSTTLEKDPYNIFLSRGPRVRLSAEQIRDQSLLVSGLLSQKMHGPPVMPYQPDNIWKSPYSNESWEMSSGEDQYRRAVYTMIKRTAVYPSLETFDMAQRQVCVSRRIRTNTPLQALVTLNDPSYVEASESLAKRMIAEGGNTLEDQINYGYYLGMSKNISEEKLDLLSDLYTEISTELKNEAIKEEERSLLAMTNVANAIINLDEMLNN